MRRTALALALLAVGLPATAAARTATRNDLHDARYCELFEVRGALPNASATVWNTIGLDDCPDGPWRALDLGALAKARGATLFVRNGPRHFLMDSATAQVGGTHRFGGIDTTRVASIPLHTAADLVQTPYTDRTIHRRNTWTWNRGRRVFELVAPGGDTYVMQSYALILDPTLTLAKLPGVGRRLKLWPGWRYRTRVLPTSLTLGAQGSATILQDDLQNTYQLATTTRPKGPRVAHPLHLEGVTKSVPPVDLTKVVEDRGTLTGTLGAGTVDLKGRFASGSFTADVRLLYPKGSVIATVTMTPVITGNEVDFTGTGRIVAGTGLYRGISSGALTVHDHNTLDGQNGTLEVDGSATF